MCIHAMIFNAFTQAITRRDFLKGSGAAGAALALSGISSPVWAAREPLTFGHLMAAQIHEPVPMILERQKLLEKEGYEAKFPEFLAGAFAMQHFSAGELQAVTVGCPPILIARGTGADIVILASSNTEGSRIVAAPEIKRVEDLAGKKVGTPGLGSIQDALLSMAEKKLKIKVSHVPIKVSDMPIYLSKKEIAAFIAWEPICSNAVDMGYGHAVYTSKDIFPGHQCCVFAVRGKWIQERPEKVQRLTNLYLESMRYFLKNQDEMLKVISQKTQISEKALKEALKVVGYPDPPLVHVESLRVFTKELIDTQKIEASKVPDVEKFVADIYNDKFIKAALKG
jgi:NitT/TauT family transport system substrate-binding protein